MTSLPHEIEPTRRSSGLFIRLTQRLRGPGGLYNLGNCIGFSGGLCAAILGVSDERRGFASALAAAADFLYGSPAAIALTLATAVFFWSGEVYHRAWARGFPPDPHQLRSGDFSSAAGAVLLALAFFALGNVVLALTAGVLHAAGKLGSALVDRTANQKPDRWLMNSTFAREVVLLSRLPAMAMGLMGLLSAAPPGVGLESQIVSGVLLLCCIVWAAADMLLLPASSILSPRRYFPGREHLPPA